MKIHTRFFESSPDLTSSETPAMKVAAVTSKIALGFAALPRKSFQVEDKGTVWESSFILPGWKLMHDLVNTYEHPPFLLWSMLPQDLQEILKIPESALPRTEESEAIYQANQAEATADFLYATKGKSIRLQPLSQYAREFSMWMRANTKYDYASAAKEVGAPTFLQVIPLGPVKPDPMGTKAMVPAKIKVVLTFTKKMRK